MSLFLAKKQEEINQKKVKDLLRLKENKKCFDCPTKSPTFVNTTIQTFICSRCSGLVREVGHRVKAISASKFSGAEALALKHGGNGIALKIWLSNYSTHSSPEPESDSDVRAFMRQKYYENKWLNRVLLQQHKEEVRTIISKNFTEDGLPIVAKSKGKIVSSGFVRVPLIADSEMNIMHDDMEEKVEIPEPVLAQNDINATSVYYPSNLPIPPTSPTALDFSRTSIDSAHSSSSSSSYNTSSSSIYSAQSGSQNIQTTPHNESNRSSMDRIQFPPTFINTRTLSAEEIAARCRDSISCNSPPIQDSNNSLTSQDCVQPSPCHTEKPPMQRTTPLLQFDVAQANRYLTREQHPFDQRMKSSALTSHERNTNAHVPYSPPVLNNAPISASPMVTLNASKARPISNEFSSIISDLAGLQLEKSVRRATYSGGMLSPLAISQPLTPSASTDKAVKSMNDPVSTINSDFFLQLEKMKEGQAPENDPYAALRGIPASHTENPEVKENEKQSSSEEEDDDDQWQEFCSSSSVDDNDNFFETKRVHQPVVEDVKPNTTSITTVDLFGDLDPRSMFKSF